MSVQFLYLLIIHQGAYYTIRDSIEDSLMLILYLLPFLHQIKYFPIQRFMSHFPELPYFHTDQLFHNLLLLFIIMYFTIQSQRKGCFLEFSIPLNLFIVLDSNPKLPLIDCLFLLFKLQTRDSRTQLNFAQY